MVEQFVSEQIKPVKAAFDLLRMAAGEPALPVSFAWRDTPYEVDQVLETWKESGPCRNGADERYLRKHWYLIRAKTGEVMTLYFDRQPRAKSQAKARWWLYTVSGTATD